MSGCVHLVVPGSLAQRTGGYIYDRRIAEGLREQGWQVRVHELAGTFPITDGTAYAAARRCLKRIAAEPAVTVIDGLALPAFGGLADRLTWPWVALVHHPLALETGLAEADAAMLDALERRLLPAAARVIATSARTTRDLTIRGVAREKIAAVLPGTDPAAPAAGSLGPGLLVLCVASLTPRKGHDVLLRALHQLRELDWRLVCVGSLERNPATAGAVLETTAELGLNERVQFVGELDDVALDAWYARADLFVLASHHEGYGMVLSEALARGLPVVATRAGAIPETVPEGAGLLVPPADPGALASALRRVLNEPSLRMLFRKEALAARERLLSWADAARAFATELRRVL